MQYSIPDAAAQLMLETGELQPVLEIFFRSATSKIVDARAALQSGDQKSLAKSMHALKGLALSLHMSRLGELAAQAERPDSPTPLSLQQALANMEEEVQELRKTVDAFYHVQLGG